MLTPIPQRTIFVIGYRSPEVTNLKEHQVRVKLDAAATGIPQRMIFVIGPEVTNLKEHQVRVMLDAAATGIE